MRDLTILHSPAQWRVIEPDLLRSSVCAVIDVIRATSTIATALARGAVEVQPVGSVPDAFALKALNPDALLAGERGGKPLPGFDRGNSPREMTEELVKGRRIILTTTNGTQALGACLGAREIVTASLLNLGATAARLKELGPPWIVVCAGCEGEFGVDDAVVAGAIAEALEQDHPLVSLYHSVRDDLAETLMGSNAGRELVKASLEADVPFCAQLDLYPVVPTLDEDGMLRIG
ncbi:MAG: 2-phosphosulfolactate phosphatase [Methylacidiphilales bacterium]|nr:2-phosphosulfolactate phosphatase [Candidatus Methylacidiphilales bacterium]